MFHSHPSLNIQDKTKYASLTVLTSRPSSYIQLLLNSTTINQPLTTLRIKTKIKKFIHKKNENEV